MAFWLLMMVLLVRVQFFADEGSLLPVPPEYVWKLLFQHEQSSSLTLYSQHQRIGSFQLQPRRLPAATDGTAGPVRLLSGSAVLPLSLPGLSSQNVTARWSLEMDEHDAVKRLGVNASIHTPGQSAAGVTLMLDGQPARDQWHYQIRRGETTWQEGSGPASRLLDAMDLRSVGIDPRALLQTGQQQVATASITAQRGTLHVNGEDLESYVVAIRHGELFETTIFVSPLGQILAVHTFGGYDLYDEALAP